MSWLNFIFKLISVLHSDQKPHNVAAGFALGSIIGLCPFFTLHNLIIFIIILVLNVSIPAAFFGIFVCSGISYLFDAQFHNLGHFLLVKVEFLKPFWTYLYNIPIAPLTRFYNTVVLGSLIISLILFYPIYLGFQQIVRFYQLKCAATVNRWKIMKIIKGNNLYQMYQKFKLQ